MSRTARCHAGSTRPEKTSIPHKGFLDSFRYDIGSRFLDGQPVPSTPGTINPWRSLQLFDCRFAATVVVTTTALFTSYRGLNRPWRSS